MRGLYLICTQKKPLECTQHIDFLILDIKPECSQGTLLMQENPLETGVL